MNKFFAIIFLLFLFSCSPSRFDFDDKIASKLCSINIIELGDSALNYEFEKHLKELLNNNCEKKYSLELKIARNSSGMVISKDAESVRDNIELIIEFKISEISSSKKLYDSKFRRISSYNTLFSPYSTNIELNYTETNLYKAAAEELRRKLILFFKRNPGF